MHRQPRGCAWPVTEPSHHHSRCTCPHRACISGHDSIAPWGSSCPQLLAPVAAFQELQPSSCHCCNHCHSHCHSLPAPLAAGTAANSSGHGRGRVPRAWAGARGKRTVVVDWATVDVATHGSRWARPSPRTPVGACALRRFKFAPHTHAQARDRQPRCCRGVPRVTATAALRAACAQHAVAGRRSLLTGSAGPSRAHLLAWPRAAEPERVASGWSRDVAPSQGDGSSDECPASPRRMSLRRS